MLCFSEQRSKKSEAAAKHSQKKLTLAFNKMPGVAEDAWFKLSDGFSNWYDRKRKNGLLEAGEGESWWKESRRVPIDVKSVSTHGPLKHNSSRGREAQPVVIWLVDSLTARHWENKHTRADTTLPHADHSVQHQEQFGLFSCWTTSETNGVAQTERGELLWHSVQPPQTRR